VYEEGTNKIFDGVNLDREGDIIGEEFNLDKEGDTIFIGVNPLLEHAIIISIIIRTIVNINPFIYLIKILFIYFSKFYHNFPLASS